jgi:hypothetical protein
MGVWTEYCLCCGLEFKQYNTKGFESAWDWDQWKTLSDAKLPDTRWLAQAIGINRFEQAVVLGEYDDYGSFELQGRKFNTVTNFVNDNYEANDDYGIVCHAACLTIVKKYLNTKLSFHVLWPMLLKQQNLGNVLRALNYGVVEKYELQDFDLVEMVQDKNQWMLVDCRKSAKSRNRILKIVRPLVKLLK